MFKKKLFVLVLSLLVSCSSNLMIKKSRVLYHPSRDKEIINNKITANTFLIGKIVNERCNHLINEDSISLKFRVLPSGKINVLKIGKIIKIDSLLEKDINNSLLAMKFDSIPKSNLITSIDIYFKKKEDAYHLKDTINVLYLEGRSKASIMKVVMKELPNLNYSYNKRLREGMDKEGKITVKFAIDEFGKVIFCKVVSSTINDIPLEDDFVEIIKRWTFKEILNPGDVTEVVYPFILAR